MKPQTVNQLNHLNQDFYTKTASDFSATRQQAWTGWTQLSQILAPELFDLARSQSTLAVLDVGCGNGRFGEFLKQTFPHLNLNYTGLDVNEHLLQIAKEKLSQSYPTSSLRLIKVDLMSDFDADRSDFIGLFGVMHHIPGFRERQQLLQKLAKQLSPGGWLVFTVWQFDRLPNLISREVNPGSIGIDPAELELNDHLLTWERGTVAVRYCHLLTDLEIQQLVNSTGLAEVSTFTADGVDGQLNRYVILQRQS